MREVWKYGYGVVRQMAKMYGVTRQMIYFILSGKAWKGVMK